jgi:hypothetical protein
VSANIAWKDIEALLVAAGCRLREGSGSHVRYDFGPHTLFFHRPHPGKEAIRYQVTDAKNFLEKIGVTP